MTCGRGWSRGGRRIAGAASALAALLPLALVLGAGRDEISDAAVPRPLSAQVTVDPAASGWPIPRSFLGASTEYWALPRSSAGLTGFERALSLLRTPGDGPLTIRIGGDSADVSLWNPGPLAAPPWLFALTPSWVQQAAQLVRDLRARLILDLNLAINSPRAAIAWVRAAEAGLPARSIVGFEIGNEPDLHTRRYLVGSVLPIDADTRLPPLGMTPRRYVRDFLSYGRALAKVAPGAPLIGPVIGNASLDADWIAALIRGAGRMLGAVSAHAYPLSACAPPGAGDYPTVERLLGERTSAGVARSVSAAVRLARRNGLPFRLTELNSVTCGGLRGVSNTFATALWAPDALFELVRAGLESADIHMRAATINAPFMVRGDRLIVRPLLYGLALFARTVGPGARQLPADLHAARPLHLKLWAVHLDRERLHLLIINKGGRSAMINLRVPGVGDAVVERLLAPSPGSRSGVTLEGQRIAESGAWSGHRRVELLSRHRGVYRLLVPGFSAALVSVRLAPASP